MKLDEAYSGHRGLLRYFRGPEEAEGDDGDEGDEVDERLAIRAAEPGPRPYLGMGSHPDVVTRVWDVLGAALPFDGRAIVFETPALVHPEAGVVLAMAFGTAYLLHLPGELAAEAIASGCRTKERWSDGTELELGEALGEGWVFGGWKDAEAAWVVAASRAVSGAEGAGGGSPARRER